MSTVKDDDLGVLLKQLLKERHISMRNLSAVTSIDTATISRIINGKRKATPDHLQKFAECLNVPLTDLLIAAGFPLEEGEKKELTDLNKSVDAIQEILKSTSFYELDFSLGRIKQQLSQYEQYGQTEEGKESILHNFEKKMQSIGSIGPFISQLKDMFIRFQLKQGTHKELMLMGGALLYFILPVDVIPDYLFPLGYLDDAIAVQIVMNLLK